MVGQVVSKPFPVGDAKSGCDLSRPSPLTPLSSMQDAWAVIKRRAGNLKGFRVVAAAEAVEDGGPGRVQATSCWRVEVERPRIRQAQSQEGLDLGHP